MKSLFSVLLGFFLLLTGNVALAQISDLNSAINKAGRQRMLSQRMAKAYFQIGQQIEVDRSKKVLDSSMAVFDRQLVELKNYAPTPEIKETYGKLEKSWLAYKDVLIGTAPSKENGGKVLAISEEVLALAIRVPGSSKNNRRPQAGGWSIFPAGSGCCRNGWRSFIRPWPGASAT